MSKFCQNYMFKLQNWNKFYTRNQDITKKLTECSILCNDIDRKYGCHANNNQIFQKIILPICFQ